MTGRGRPRGLPHICGCYFTETDEHSLSRVYLPQVKLDAHTTILSTASSTVLTQTFINPSKVKPLGEIRYTFPLYDGISVVNFKCQVGDRVIYGLVKEKEEARATYEEAKARGENAGLVEQLPDAADVFTTSIANIPENAEVIVTIKYIQELKHDAEVDGIRLTMPTSIAPRYGSYPGDMMRSTIVDESKGISITVDISMSDTVPIRKVISPSHPIDVSLGTLSTDMTDEGPSLSKASASLALGTTELEKDFVLQIAANDIGIPQAILETHPVLPNQRALMTTLVPKFALKAQKPEVIFIADRSGSMSSNIPTLIKALMVFLKSLPIGVMFNICSFGSSYSFLWKKSKLYGKDTLDEAVKHVSQFDADFGGTETFTAVEATIKTRHKEMNTELMLLTDGDIWSQQQMFDYIEKETRDGQVRVFPLGIGGGVSSSLIEGVARAGRGFAQMVANNEKLDGKIVRMLKGALTPHITDYTLEIKYEDDSVDKVAEALNLKLTFEDEEKEKTESGRYPLRDQPISLYDPQAKDEHPKANEPKDRFAFLPKLDRPKLLQTPRQIPPLYPFNRTCVYLLMSPETSELQPKSVVLKGTAPEGQLELEIPVQVRQSPEEAIHQLAARKAAQELEEGYGWVYNTRTKTNTFVRDQYPAQFESLLQREAVRLGVEFQVGGKYCSFVAVESNEVEVEKKRKKALEKLNDRSITTDDDEDFEMVDHSNTEPEIEVSGITPSSSAAPAKRRRTGGAPRSTTGGKAPRKQLASKAARKSAPSGPPPRAIPATTRGNTGAKRHRRIRTSPDVEAEVDEDMGFGLFDGGSEDEKPGKKKKGSSKKSSSPENEKSMDKEAVLQRLIKKQSFEGSWSRDSIPCDAMGVDRDAARAAIQKLASAKRGLAEDVIATALTTAIVVVFLERKYTAEQETWELLVDKAKEWLGDAGLGKVLQQVWKNAESLVGTA